MTEKTSKIKGCLIGGAAGDALGYAVEFCGEDTIFQQFGEKGITEYQLHNGRALISDDTQMTMFTAGGIISGLGGEELLQHNIADNYQNWYDTQTTKYTPLSTKSFLLLNIPELYSRRAPGNTCMSALQTRRYQQDRPRSYISDTINNSCGCGGVMRVAPIGFIDDNIKNVDLLAAEAAAITHSHPLGYIPAAILAHIVNRCIYPSANCGSLAEIVADAAYVAEKIFRHDKHLDKQIATLKKAIELSENSAPDLDNIHALGEGWVGDEALNIAVYCALRHKDNFSDAIIAAVNHKGDSDSTGAICGNILGAYLGYDRIEDKWKNNLELKDEMLKLAERFV